MQYVEYKMHVTETYYKYVQRFHEFVIGRTRADSEGYACGAKGFDPKRV